MAAGLLPPDDGTIELIGRIGYIPQGHSILANLTVLENTALPHFLQNQKGDPYPDALALLGRAGVDHLAGQYPSQLSGGELRRVSVARSLVTRPNILIADEPTSDLDSDNADNIMRLFAEIASDGTAIIVATHDLSRISFASRELVISEGRLVSCRSVSA